MEYFVQTDCVKVKKLFDAILPSIFSQLHLNKFNSFVTIIVSSEDCDETQAGWTIPTTIPGDTVEGYVVVLRYTDLSKMTVTLVHELVHVYQYLSGMLIMLGEGFFVWCNKVFGPETEYTYRPWEISALQKQEIVALRALT